MTKPDFESVLRAPPHGTWRLLMVAAVYVLVSFALAHT